jgi:hypothetical protein
VNSRLDRIEAWAKFALKNGGPEDKFGVVLALVDVAKAAEYAEDELRKYGTGVHLIGARHRLYDALAVLDEKAGEQ